MSKSGNKYTYHYAVQLYGTPASGVITVPFRVFDYDTYEDLKIKIAQRHTSQVKEILSLSLLGCEPADDLTAVQFDALTADANISVAIATYRKEGINFVANRLLAAYEHGFIDKPAKEVGGIARMILSAKEEINTATTADCSTEYSDLALAEILTALHSGGSQ